MPSTQTLRFGVLAAVLAAGILAACDSVSAPSEVPSPSPSAQAGPCTGAELEASGIDGTVVDAEGNPLDDILILVETGSGFTGDTRTGQEGTFSAGGVTGEFTISTVDIGYQEVVRRVTVTCGETVEVELVLTPVGG